MIKHTVYRGFFDITDLKMKGMPHTIQEDDPDYISMPYKDGTKEDLLAAAKENNAKYIHLYKNIKHEYFTENYEYVASIDNPNYKSTTQWNHPFTSN